MAIASGRAPKHPGGKEREGGGERGEARNEYPFPLPRIRDPLTYQTVCVFITYQTVCVCSLLTKQCVCSLVCTEWLVTEELSCSYTDKYLTHS